MTRLVLALDNSNSMSGKAQDMLRATGKAIELADAGGDSVTSRLGVSEIQTARTARILVDGVAVERELLRHPERFGADAPQPYVTRALANSAGPVVAVSDWMRAVPEQIRPWVPGTYVTLGTDGFGFSDTRPAARRYFNTDAESVVVATLQGLARDGAIDPSVAVAAAKQYRIDDVFAAAVSYRDTGSA